MNLQLRHKVAGLAVGAIMLTLLVVLALVMWQEWHGSRLVEETIDDLVEENLSQVVRGVYGLCETSDALIQDQVDGTLNVARLVLRNEGGFRLGEGKVDWRAVNQYTREATEIELPEVIVGGVGMRPGVSADERLVLVDEVRDLVGGTVTLFQRVNARGDMLRVATNVLEADGRRALGTFIPAVNPDGKANSVVTTVLGGETYRGRAYVVNAWYLTAYEPVFDDETGEVVGMLYVGVHQQAVENFSDAIRATRVSDNGELWIVYGTDSRWAGQPALPGAAAGLDGIGVEQRNDLLADALKLSAGEVAGQRMTVTDPSTGEEETVYLRYTYFPRWDWVIGVRAPGEDFSEPRDIVSTAFLRLIYWTVGGGLATAVLVGALAVFLGGRIAAPLTVLSGVAGEVAEGRLVNAAQRLERLVQTIKLGGGSESGDECHILVRAFDKMINSLKGFLGEVHMSARELEFVSRDLLHTSTEQESAVQEFGSSTNEIAAAVKEISATSKELSNTMNTVSDVAQDTARMADSGRAQLDVMKAGVEGLSVAAATIAAKLSVISEKANNINAVVTTITRVADQTNLLSLNAAIEAEKAGEYGVGFAVVAREIRRLADQTAVATQDIEQIVSEMHGAVSAGVMEMDKFNDEVRRGVREVAEMTGQMEQIIQRVGALTPRFDAVREGMDAQALGTGQITEAVVSLNASARKTSEALNQFRNAVSTLQDAVNALESGVSRFEIESCPLPQSGLAGGDSAKPTA